MEGEGGGFGQQKGKPVPYLRDPLIFISSNQGFVLRRDKQASFWADLSDRLTKPRQDDRRLRGKRSATSQVAAAQPTVLPAKNEGMLEGRQSTLMRLRMEGRRRVRIVLGQGGP